MDLAKLSRDDMIVGGLGVFLIIDLLFLPWYSVVGFTFSATSAPYSIWGVLALLVDIAFVGDLALERFAGAQLPVIGSSRATTRTALAGGTLAFLVIKLLAHTGNLSYGAFLGLVAAVALVVLCVRETAS
jgi:hypothetical protein